ncbi:MAG: LON peptidase substrate-binding domain-containing protein [Planctomycetota bacterium]
MDFQLPEPSLPNGAVPVFPLGGVFLFPHQVLPLHIFEPRYRDMVADLLDGPGRLVIASPLIGESETDDHVPEIVPVGGLGEILRHEKHPDGRYSIWVLGVARVHIQEVPSDKLYRQVEVLPFVETDVPEETAFGLAEELREAATARLKEPLPLPDSTPPGLLADLLMQTLQAPRSLIERVYAEPDVEERARMALREANRGDGPDVGRPDLGSEDLADGKAEVDLQEFDGDAPDRGDGQPNNEPDQDASDGDHGPSQS